MLQNHHHNTKQKWTIYTQANTHPFVTIMTTESSLRIFYSLILFSLYFANYISQLLSLFEFLMLDIGCPKTTVGDRPCLDASFSPRYSITPFLNRTGEEKIRWKNLHGTRQRPFNKTKKRLNVEEKEYRRFYSLTPISRKCPGTSQEAGLHHTQSFLWKTNVIIMFVLPISPLS